MARSAATAAKETYDNNALEDASKPVIDVVKAESTKLNISSSLNAAITAGLPQEHKGPDPDQRCPLPSAELTTHQPQVRHVPLQPDEPPGEQLAGSVPPCCSQPDCPWFDNESLNLEQRLDPLSEVPRLIGLRVLRQAAGLPVPVMDDISVCQETFPP